MTGQNDWQDESLTGQVRDQAGHCLLTGRYFQPRTPAVRVLKWLRNESTSSALQMAKPSRGSDDNITKSCKWEFHHWKETLK